MKIARQKTAERQSAMHAGGLGFYRLIKGFADFGEILNPLDNFGNAIAPAMNAGNKFDVLAACHGALKASAEAYWPGDPAIAGDGAFVCCIHTANDSE